MSGLHDYDPERDGEEERWAASLALQGLAVVGTRPWPVDRSQGSPAAPLESAPGRGRPDHLTIT